MCQTFPSLEGRHIAPKPELLHEIVVLKLNGGLQFCRRPECVCRSRLVFHAEDQ